MIIRLLWLSESITIITSLAKGGYVFGSVGLSVCVSVCGQHYPKSYELFGMKFYGGVGWGWVDGSYVVQ